MKRRVISVLLVFALVVLVGCSRETSKDVIQDKNVSTQSKGDKASKEEAPKPVTITIGCWPQPDDEAANKEWNEYKRICEERYPYITVKPAPYQYDPNTFIPMAVSGQVPTVIDTYFTEPAKLIEGGFVADITDIAKAKGYDTAINKGFMDIATKEGRIYGLPKGGYGLGLAINLNLFRQAGLLDEKGLPIYPKTFDELLTTAKTITEKTGQAGMFIPSNNNVGGWHFTQLAWAFGAKFEKQVNGKWISNIDTPEVLKAFEYIRDLKWKHKVLLPDLLLGWNEWIENIGTDKVAMSFVPGDSIAQPVIKYKMDKDQIALMPMPKGTGGHFSLTGGGIYVFSSQATAEEIDATIKFLEITGFTSKVTDETKKALDLRYKTKKENGEPVVPGIPLWVAEERENAEREAIAKYSNVNQDLYKDYLAITNDILRPEEPILCQSLYQILDQVIQKVFTDENADIKKALEEADAKFQKDFLDKLK